MSLEHMNITTDRYNLLVADRERLRVVHEAAIVRENTLKAANARLVEQKTFLHNMLNRLQGVAGAARGNIVKVEKEIQEYLKSVI